MPAIFWLVCVGVNLLREVIRVGETWWLGWWALQYSLSAEVNDLL
jgi:hypothetical protein